MKAQPVAIDLPNQALPGADWADCFEVTVLRPIGAMEAARLAFSRMPGWVKALMGLRDVVMRPFGLVGRGDQMLRKWAHVGFFPVVSESAGELVLGFDDRHLDFRILIETQPHAEGKTRVRLATLIRRHNLLGRLYLAVIIPFHKLIVVALMNRID